MMKLEKLEIEQEIIRNLSYIPATAKQMIDLQYGREINGIKNQGCENLEVNLANLEKIKLLLIEKLKEA